MPLPAADRGAPYDALLVQSFGGPDGPADVDGFLANVLRGREVNEERLAEIRARYLAIGGISPITAQTEALRTALASALASRGLQLPVYVGARNWHPYLADTVTAMAADGVRRALVLVTSAYSSYSGCRQYREDRDRACAQSSAAGLALDRIRHYFDHPGFVDAMADNVATAWDSLAAEGGSPVRIVFTTHSLPQALADRSGPPEFHGQGTGGAYVAQHRGAAGAVIDRLTQIRPGRYEWELVFQSRSGAPTTPWLGPDVNDRLTELAGDGVAAIVLAPIGFVSDHMEVIWDLDVEAAQRCGELGISVSRASTVGTSAVFVAGLVELVAERVDLVALGMTPVVRSARTPLGPSWDDCDDTCCPPLMRPRTRESR